MHSQLHRQHQGAGLPRHVHAFVDGHSVSLARSLAHSLTSWLSLSHLLTRSLAHSLLSFSLSTCYSLTPSLLHSLTPYSLPLALHHPPFIHCLCLQCLFLFGKVETHSCLYALSSAQVLDPLHCPTESGMMQALAVTVQKATKRNADKDSKPRRSKKRKGNEITGTEGADSSSQPQAAAEGQPLQGGPLQWGGKQKRKHTRQASCGLPDQAHGASQQRLLRPYLATPPVVAHPSKGDLPAATVSAAASPDGLCDAKG